MIVIRYLIIIDNYFFLLGYGMVMPPFAPHPYMESPAYILPHPHIQPVDYRRFLHPQVHAPNVPYQNPNHSRRVRPQNPAPCRETVNCAVQTESTQRPGQGYMDGSPPIRSDSGHGSATDSPSSSSSVTNKPLVPEIQGYILTNEKTRALQTNACTNGTGKLGPNVHLVHPAELKTTQSNFKAAVATQPSQKDKDGRENPPHVHKNTRRSMWSVDSQESLIPVCSSSQQEDETTKERRRSFPDILMSWGGSTPLGTRPTDLDKVLGQDAKRLQSEENKEKRDELDCQGPKERNANADTALDADRILSVSDKPPDSTRTKVLFASSVRQCLAFADEQAATTDQCNAGSICGHEGAVENSLEEPTEVIPYEMIFNSCSQTKRKLNESVWSVESLCPFIPKDWTQHRSILESEVIIETTEDVKNEGVSGLSGKLVLKPCKERNPSVSESVPVSDSWLLSKQPEFILEPAQVQGLEPRTSPPVQNLSMQQEDLSLILRTKEVEEDGSSEPEASRSPNQEPAAVSGQGARSSSSLHQAESLPLSSTVEDNIPSKQRDQSPVETNVVAAPPTANPKGVLLTTEPRVPVTKRGLSPSKGHFVDCAVQCSKLLPCSNECCEELFSKQIKYSGSRFTFSFLGWCH